MREFDSSELRARVISDFMCASRDVTDAMQMNRLVDAMMKNALGAVREMLHAFNCGSFMAHVPPEVLAACFAHLPLGSRLSPSHVCRSWRAAALSAPELWSRIGPGSPSNSPGFLQTVLSRAGALPIYMKLDSTAPMAADAIYTAITPFSRRIRYLSWHMVQPISPWDFPAPLMRCFCSSKAITITERFLGGHAGRLRYLYLQYVQLPTLCPALSTVTEFSVALTPYYDDGVAPSMLGNLFNLLLRLEFLSIRGITRSASHLLPSGPAPASLSEMWLHSRTTDYDLMPHFLEYDSGNFRRVWLDQCSGTHPNLEPLARGTVRFVVTHGSDTATTHLGFEHSATVYHSMSLLRVDLSDTAALLAAVQPSLSDVHTAMISHVTLKPLVGLLAALPKLAHVFLHIVPTTVRGYYSRRRPPVFDWEHLSCLSDLAHVQCITLHVWCGDDRRPSVASARGLIAQLTVLPGTLPLIEIQGFSEELLASVDVAGLNVRFDMSAELGDLVLHKRREAYDPFRSDED